MPLDSEKISSEGEESIEEKLIASLLSLERSADPVIETTPKNLRDKDYYKIKSDRWRDSICTVVRKTETEVSTSPDLWIFPDDLLSDREKEQKKLRKLVPKNYTDRKFQDTFAYLWGKVLYLLGEESTEPKVSEQSHPMVSEESQTNEENLTDSNQSKTSISKEFASQTTCANSDVSQQTESVASKESASQTTVGSADISKASGVSSDSLKQTDATKGVQSDDHVFALPSVPPQRSSTRQVKPRKVSNSDDLSDKSDTSAVRIQPSGSRTSRDTPDPRRRSSRLSSKSCSEKDEDSESSEEKLKVKSATKSKREKKLESSGGESDEGRSTRSSRRLKK